MQYLPRSLDEAIKGSRVSIVAYQHGQGLHMLPFRGSHYVAVRHIGEQFEVFNDGDRFKESIDEWLSHREVLVLITVR